MMQLNNWRDLAVSLSLANLLLLRLWPQIISQDISQNYYIKYQITHQYIVLLWFNVLVFTLIYYVLRIINNRSNSSFWKYFCKLVFILSLFFPANSLRMFYPNIINFNKIINSNTIGHFGIIIGCIVLLVVTIKYLNNVYRFVSVMLMLMLPFVLITLSCSALTILNYNKNKALYIDKMNASLLKTNRNVGKVLWLIFDELDQRIAFDKRPSTLKLPALDRLRNESFYASNAEPPAGETLLSLPAYITGKKIINAKPIRADELMLTLSKSGDAVGWSTLPNIFTRAHELGANSALIGWAHPYSRVIGGSLQSSYWEPNTYDFNFTNPLKIMLKQIQFALEIPSVPIFGRTIQTELHINSYRNILETTKKAIVDQNINLVLAHFPVPHAPYIYDRNSSKFVLRHNRPPSAYLDNLKLVDITLDNIRSVMETSGIWDNTTIIVTSDHWWRKSNEYDGTLDHRVPFIVKLSGNSNKAVYTKRFNTIIAHDMVLAILNKRINSNETLIAFINGRLITNDTISNK